MAEKPYTITKAVRTRREALATLGTNVLAGVVTAAAIAMPDGLAQPTGGVNLQANASVGHIRDIPANTSAGDAELLALIAQFNYLEQTADELFAKLGSDDPDDVFASAHIWPLLEQQKPLFDQIMKIRATTLEGYRARAKMFFLWEKELEAEAQESAEPAGWPERMRWALVRDLVGEDA